MFSVWGRGVWLITWARETTIKHNEIDFSVGCLIQTISCCSFLLTFAINKWQRGKSNRKKKTRHFWQINSVFSEINFVSSFKCVKSECILSNHTSISYLALSAFQNKTCYYNRNYISMETSLDRWQIVPFFYLTLALSVWTISI